MNGFEFISDSFNESSLSFDITDGPVSEGTIGEWSTDGNWTGSHIPGIRLMRVGFSHNPRAHRLRSKVVPTLLG